MISEQGGEVGFESQLAIIITYMNFANLNPSSKS